MFSKDGANVNAGLGAGTPNDAHVVTGQGAETSADTKSLKHPCHKTIWHHVLQ